MKDRSGFFNDHRLAMSELESEGLRHKREIERIRERVPADDGSGLVPEDHA